MDLRETDTALKQDLNENDAKITAIGPAGENLVKFAAIMNSVYHAAGRGGAGAVMGSKRLKAIVTKGTGSITVANPERFTELAIEARKDLANHPVIQGMYNYGTSGDLETINEMGRLPCFNFRATRDERASLITGHHLVKAGYLRRRVGCFSCAISCHRYTVVDEGPFAGAYSGGPEYETCFALGSGVGVFDTEAVIKANELCNIFGLDTISTGNVIQWAMESYEREVLTKKDTDGFDLRFGNMEALAHVIPLIAHREGKLGELLADGVKEAADKLGHDSWKWAMSNSKGLDLAGTDTRFTKGYALAFAVNPRGPDHLHTQVLAEFGGSPEAIELIEKITGDKKWASSVYIEYRPEIVRFYEDVYTVTDALGFCTFTEEVVHTNPEFMSEIFMAATGVPMQAKKLMLTGKRILTLEKCFNIRLGADRKFDDLPYRMMHEPAPPGSHQEGATNSPQELNMMLDRYYELHGWDSQTSWPYRETLNHLDLDDVANELQTLNKLPKKS
jgi:aldehyde:ferredoxin oxidoreductase